MHKRWVPFMALAMVAATAWPLGVHAQERATALTLDRAIALALAHSPALRAARHEWEAGEGAVIQAGARQNPELLALVEDTRKETRTTTFQLSQPMELGGQRAARMAAAQWAREQAAVDLQARRALVRADVVEAYFACAIAQERVRLAQASVGLAEQAFGVAAKRVRAGKVSPVEENRAQVAQVAARLERVQAEGDWRVNRERLDGLLGTPASQSGLIDAQAAVQSAAGPVMSSLVSAQAVRLDDAPALRLARMELERRRAQVDLEQARRTPDVTLTLGSKRVEELGRNQLLMGISLPLAVWDRNQGGVLQALRLRDKAQADLAEVQIQVETQWRALTERRLSAQAEVQALQQDILPGAEQAWQAAVTGFELGKFSFLETLDAQRTLFQARAQYLRALGDLHRAGADIDRLLGNEGIDPVDLPALKDKP